MAPVSRQGVPGSRNIDNVRGVLDMDIPNTNKRREAKELIVSQTSLMLGEILDEALALNTTSLHDASAIGINTEVFPAVARGQMDQMLRMAKRLNDSIKKDAEILENRMRNNREPDEYGRDAESGKLPGRYLGLAKE